MMLLDPAGRVDSREALGRQLRQARTQLGLTDLEVGTVAHVARSTVGHAESGDAPVNIDQLLRITAALGLDLYLVPRRPDEPT